MVRGSSEQSMRVTSGCWPYRSMTLLRDPLASVRVRVHEGQTQAAMSFCMWLVAICVFSLLLLDNISMDVNTLLIWGFQRPVWPSARKGLPVLVLCCVTRQTRVTSRPVPFSYFIHYCPHWIIFNVFLFLFLFLRKFGGYVFLNNPLKSEAFTPLRAY